MKAWDSLTRELDLWATAGQAAPIWWRDDDAVTDTAQLQRLLEINAQLPGGLGLAVVPDPAEEALAQAVEGHELLVLQHGFAHISHAPDSDRTIELGPHRPVEAVLAELNRGWTKLSEMFAAQAAPVLVPPWNRIDASLAARLAEAGYLGLSSIGPARPEQAPGVKVANCHFDLFVWKPRGFKGETQILAEIVARLEGDRRAGFTTPEVLGFMTHHLVHDEEVWSFLHRFAMVLTTHPGLSFMGPRAVFGVAGEEASAR